MTNVRLPEAATVRGRRLKWRNGPLVAADPLSAWQQLLEARAVGEGNGFFSPCLASLPDPSGIVDMEKAVTRLVAAVESGESIHVFGDFDCDGVCGTAILVEALRSLGMRLSFSIPHRVDDGHGIDVKSVRAAASEGVRLGISVDTGTNCHAACAEAKRLGMDLIITDHHLPDREPAEAFALLNPAREDCGFAGRRLCGTGVAFFLLMALWRRLKNGGRKPHFDLRRLLDRVAVATVADVMELQGVNRILVFHGLRLLNEAPAPGMAALIRVARLRPPVTVEGIAFHLAPRLNAAGRMRHGVEAMRLLAAEDVHEADRLAAVLDDANRHRRRIENDVFREAQERLAAAQVLAAFDPGWHAGVVGLAAGRLARKYGRPAAVGFITPEGCIRISLRAVPGFHVGRLLEACAGHLQRFGGHAGAGGGTLTREQWPGFVRTFGQAVEAQARRGSDAGNLAVDGILGPGALHAGLAKRLQRFEPTGEGNPPFRWLLEPMRIRDRRNLKGGVLRLTLGDGPERLQAVVFKSGPLDSVLAAGGICSLIGQLQMDAWRGGESVQFVVEDAIAPSDRSASQSG
jgi:single-stranded-DNA-specific exonuclease RecJ